MSGAADLVAARSWSEHWPTVHALTDFWRLVDRGADDECWPWLGDRDGDNYGVFCFMGDKTGAHEFAVFASTGEVRPVGWDTCHSCHNPPCVNPSHLSYGTRRENVRQMVDARRHNPNAKLTDEQALEIRHRVANGASIARLAEHYRVSPSSISEVASGKKWKHAGGPISTRRPGRPRKRTQRVEARNGVR